MPTLFVPAGLALSGMALLLEAFDCARDAGSSPWDYAIGVPQLREAGVSNSSLTWLLQKEYAEHLVESTVPGDVKRVFRSVETSLLSERSCLVLSETGALFVGSLFRSACSGTGCGSAESPDIEPLAPQVDESAKPHFDATRRRFLVGAELVKQFRGRIANQERLLSAFEEEGWPPCVDDPLPGPKEKSNQRLHDTVKALNHHQIVPRVHFFRDGTGERVCWEWFRPNDAAVSPRRTQ
jgi:hypothetical protein